MRLAVIGGGISGLTCAWYLHREHDVVVYEANGYAGGHTDTHAITVSGRSFAIDSGFIVFNEQNYPNFTHLLRDLGVEWQDSDMSFSAVNERTGMEYGAEGLGRLFAQRRNLLRPAFYRMLWDLVRFYRQAPLALERADEGSTLGQYLRSGNYSQAFIDNHILPMACALWSASAEIIEQFPLQHFLAFMNNHHMLQFNDRPQWKVVKGGSSQYVKKILSALNQPPSPGLAGEGNKTAGATGSAAQVVSIAEQRVRLNTSVTKVSRGRNRHAKAATVTTEKYGDEGFDAVIFACHSDQALRLLADASENERHILGSIPYQENHITLHSDERMMPVNRTAWASWNARIPADASERCQVSYWMNSLQSIDSDTPFIVSLNCRDRIEPQKIWAERIYHHPVFTQASIEAQRARPMINGVNNTWFCGAYWGWGFHEDGVKSALNVVEAITEGDSTFLSTGESTKASWSAGKQVKDANHVTA